jgi:hypothetical protein
VQLETRNQSYHWYWPLWVNDSFWRQRS